jgi:Xaa-Pro aminopeptidase
VPVEVEGAEKKTLGFETLTFAPIDRSLIAAEMLTLEERAWLDDYHAEVLKIVGPLVDGEARKWLTEACRPL